MPQNSREFAEFVARHFPQVEAICRKNARFSGDDEILAFLRGFEEEDKNLMRLVSRMKEVGVLIELVGQWAPPPFLAEFIARLDDCYALASPKVIQGWVDSLEKLVDALLQQINSAHFDFGAFDVEEGRSLLRDISHVFHTITRTVHDNCQRIAAEVGEFE